MGALLGGDATNPAEPAAECRVEQRFPGQTVAVTNVRRKLFAGPLQHGGQLI